MRTSGSRGVAAPSRLTPAASGGVREMSVTIDDIRVYCKDIEPLNVLLRGRLQSSDELIMLAMKLAANDFNIVPPVSNASVENFPSDTILIYGTLHHLCNAEAERQLRNQVTYSAQGLNAGIDDKFEQYNRLATYYKQLFDQKLTEYKQYQNLDKAWGGSASPYACINEYQYRG